MIFITTYKVKPYLSKEETNQLMGVFAKHGAGPGAQAHYVATDGSGGLVISDIDDLGASYRNLLNFTEWVEYDTKPFLSIDDAVPHILDSLG
jgi:hypothetical protein